jgi:thiamine-monophosphate kinase
MNLRKTSEREFLRALSRRHRRVMPPSPHGPGDDAAFRKPHLVTTDALLEGVHFRRSEPPFLIGRKALSVNLSDIAAMGGRPQACLLSMGVPHDLPRSFVESFTGGFASAAQEANVQWIGGDTVRSVAGIALSVTVLGAPGRSLLTRSGARSGDGIYVTGTLGGSAAGRRLLEEGWRVRPPSPRSVSLWRHVSELHAGRRLLPLLTRRSRGGAGAPLRRATAAVLIARHLDPVPRVAAAAFLSRRSLASAAMDLSDGLSVDLARLCEASGTGALILKEAIPISRETRAWVARAVSDPFLHAVNGGEDYEILFTVPSRMEPRLARWPVEDETGPFRIGRIRPASEGIRVIDARGRLSPLRPRGYDAFRKNSLDGSPSTFVMGSRGRKTLTDGSG